jgi:deferrochelatase/peroxidase EfeB
VDDVKGVRCPLSSHIRKVNPRDGANDLGTENDTPTLYLLPRGISYGPPVADVNAADDGAGRGLLFVAYQASISEQFETLQRRWANRDTAPAGGGHDPIIGESAGTAGRARRFELVDGNGNMCVATLMNEYLTPTGGGYFFAPSIGAIRDCLAADPQ